MEYVAVAVASVTLVWTIYWSVSERRRADRQLREAERRAADARAAEIVLDEGMIGRSGTEVERHFFVANTGRGAAWNLWLGVLGADGDLAAPPTKVGVVSPGDDPREISLNEIPMTVIAMAKGYSVRLSWTDANGNHERVDGFTGELVLPS